MGIKNIQNIETKQFIKLKDFIRKQYDITSDADFSEKMGIDYNKIKNINANKQSVTLEILSIICNKVGLSYDYFRKENEVEYFLLKENKDMQESGGNYISLTDSKLPIPISQQFILPMLGDASAGYIVEYYEHETYMESFNLPLQRGQNIRGFVVQGDSMYPMLNNGDIVFCKRVLDFNIHKFLFKDAYIIVCSLGVCIKHIVQTANGLRLVSDNSQYKDIELNGEEVYEVWRVEGKYIRF